MYEIQPLHYPNHLYNFTSIFLAGSIDMGKAEPWQQNLANRLFDYDVVIYNPRKENWDNTVKNHYADKNLREQVNWELINIENSKIIVFYFDPNQLSPISLLEFGLAVGSGKRVVVCCPDGYWRQANIIITCEMYDIPFVFTFEDLVIHLKDMLKDSKNEEFNN